MGVSQILDKRYNLTKIKKEEVHECDKNKSDCAFNLGDNVCAAEWCIFSELPKMNNMNKKIKCIFCNKTKEVSTYNLDSNYICDDCIGKIREKMNE